MDLAQLEKLKTIFYILFWGFSILALLSNAFVSGYIKPKIDEKKAAIEASRIGRDSRKISQLQAHLGEARTANQFFAELDNKINELFVMIRLNEDLNFTSEIYENFEIVFKRHTS